MTKPLRGRVIEPTFPLLGGISAGTVMPRNEGNVETLPATSRKQKAQRHPSVFMLFGRSDISAA